MLTKSPYISVPSEGLDPFGKILSKYIEDGWTTNTYNAAGEITSRITDQEAQKFKWDPWGNLIEITSNDYNWKASYDVLGRRLQTHYLPKQGQAQTVISLYDPHKEFDEIGVKFNDKTFWKFIKDGTCHAMLDEHGNAVSLVYDALGKLIAVIDSEDIHWMSSISDPLRSTRSSIPITTRSRLFCFSPFLAKPTRRSNRFYLDGSSLLRSLKR